MKADIIVSNIFVVNLQKLFLSCSCCNPHETSLALTLKYFLSWPLINVLPGWGDWRRVSDLDWEYCFLITWVSPDSSSPCRVVCRRDMSWWTWWWRRCWLECCGQCRWRRGGDSWLTWCWCPEQECWGHDTSSICCWQSCLWQWSCLCCSEHSCRLALTEFLFVSSCSLCSCSPGSLVSSWEVWREWTQI